MSRNIAIVGCGAISQIFYLPALVKLGNYFDRVWLVDPSDRVLAAASRIVDFAKASSFSEVANAVDFVVIAAPNAMHFKLAHDALLADAHVLVEKPFVTFPDDGRQLLAEADARNRVIAVNQTRRVFPIARDLRRRISKGEFGSLVSIEHLEGVKLNWSFESGAAFAKDAQRTGVIMDLGVHVIDFYQYLFQPVWNLVDAVHDGFCGPEGLTQLQLEADGVPVSIRLSRYQVQNNIARLKFTDATVLVDVFDWNTFSVSDLSGNVRRVATLAQISNYEDLAVELLLNFVAASEGREQAFCDASSSLPVIHILDEIYRMARRYPTAVGAI